MIENISYKHIVESINDGLYFVDKNRIITYWNSAAERITGYMAEEVVGNSCADNILTHVDDEGNNLCLGGCPLSKTIEDGKSRETNVFLNHKNGYRVPVFVRANQLIDEHGQVIGGIELFTDMSNVEANELRVKELERLALLDKLTELANRHYLENEIEARLHDLSRNNIPFGVLFMDIDHFKTFNDTYGHNVGDKVLQLVAKTFVANARPYDLYGRWGGEEFVAIIRNVSSQDLEKKGNRIRALVQSSCLMHETEKLSVTISIGVTMARGNDTLDTLIKRADDHLYQSKQAGRNRITID